MNWYMAIHDGDARENGRERAAELDDAETLSTDYRKVRDIGNAIGLSLDLEALRKLGLVENGDDELTEEVYSKVEIRDDGRVLIDLDP